MGARTRIAAFAALAAGGLFAAPALSQLPPASPDDFVAAAAGASQYEMMAARLALVESKDTRVRDFATVMLRDHATARVVAGRRASLESQAAAAERWGWRNAVARGVAKSAGSGI